MSRVLLACTATLLFTALPCLSAAQDPALPLPASGPAPANLSFVDGAVDLIHDGVAERAASGTMLLDGDTVRTANGRVEIVFADGSLLHLDHDTDLEVLSPLRVRLREGRVLVRVSAAATAPYVVDTPAASVTLESRGEYGISASGRFERLEVTVARGAATLSDGGAQTVVRAGEMASIIGAGGRVLLQPFNSARWDAFAVWAADRTNGFAATPSARQLPVELRPYGPVLESYGRWDYLAPYGYVWFPAVGTTWRPYYTGAWVTTRYGWTWVGHDPWAWPTHHYGRWGFTGASWYWIPNRVWGPAWVSFNFVSNYVSWCPLGWDGRPVFAMHGPGRPGDHPDFRPNYDPWRGWTVAPREAFGRRRAVQTYAIDPARLPDETRRAMSNAVPRGSFSVAAPPPNRGEVRGVAPPSRPTPGSIAVPTGGYAVPRATAPAADDRTRRDAAPERGERRGGVRDPQRVVPAPRAERPLPEGRPAPQERPARQDPPPRAERPVRQERPAPAERAGSGGRAEPTRGHGGGVAVPRSGQERAQPAPSGGAAEGGAARRRPR